MSRKAERNRNEEIALRKFHLDFFTAELTTHARLLIGFAAILFAILDLTYKIRMDVYHFDIRFWIALGGIFLVSFAIWFTLMRTLAYSLQTAGPRECPSEQINEIRDFMCQYILKKKLVGVIPSTWFISTGSVKQQKDRRKGTALCAIFAIVSTFCLAWLIGIQWSLAS